MQVPSVTTIKVLKPAEWRLLARSQPITAPATMAARIFMIINSVSFMVFVPSA